MVVEGGAPFSAPTLPPRENGWMASVKTLMGCTLAPGPRQLKTPLAFCEVQRVSSCGPSRRQHGAPHDQIELLQGVAGYCLWNVFPAQVAVVLSENPQAPAHWVPPGGPAPGREPREGCLTKRLFPLGNPQLPSVLGSAGWSGTRAQALECFAGILVASGSPLVASGLPPPPPLPPFPRTR